MEKPIKTMAEMAAKGETPAILFWVGCAGAFDDRYKKVTKTFASILQHLDISFAVLGTEESCTGDPARRAGNCRDRGAPPRLGDQRAPCGQPSRRQRRPDPDRAGAAQPDQERHGGDAAAAAGAARAADQRAAQQQQAGGGGDRRLRPRRAGRHQVAAVRRLLHHQERRHGHGPESVPQHCRVPPGPYACREPLQWFRGCRLPIFILAAAGPAGRRDNAGSDH